MSSAFCEPPDSGVNVSAKADGTQIRQAARAAPRAVASRRLGTPVGKARRIISAPSGRSPLRARCPERERLSALERGLPLLDEGGHALLEVACPGERVLELGLEVE